MTLPLGTIDFETDPFDAGATIKPFCVGVKTDETYWQYWGDDCAEQLVVYLASIEHPHIWYAHNGGNFDFYFLLSYIEDDILLINNRIVKCWLGHHQLRDSYAIFPDPLSAYKKDELTDDDYRTKFRRDNREAYKDFILGYMSRDCGYLLEAVSHFHQRFGDHLTIGGCAMKQLRKQHKFQAATKQFHEKFQHFYFGGRNQCFENGVIKGDFNIYDINSQYPSVMRNFRHPVGNTFNISNKIGPRTFFAEIEARNYGALPTRTRKGLDFTRDSGVFHATIHEIEAGLETGSIEVLSVLAAYNFTNSTTFAEYVDKFFDLRLGAKRRLKIDAEDNHAALENLFYKRIVNSSYGKFAQNPDNYMDYTITHGENPGPDWRLEKTNGDYYIWGKPSKHKTYYNIATGASITGAARSVLLRGLRSAVRPIYCDTDSIFCERLGDDVQIDPDILGAWKHEGTVSELAIAGKKLYAAWGDFGTKDGEQVTVKKAHKGSILTAEQIRSIAEGETIEYASKAPKFRLDGSVIYVKRQIKRTTSNGTAKI